MPVTMMMFVMLMVPMIVARHAVPPEELGEVFDRDAADLQPGSIVEGHPKGSLIDEGAG
jgi:hypothetical protein